MLHLIQGYGVIQKCAQVLIDEITTLKKRIYKVVHLGVQVQIQILPSRSLTISHETMANLLYCNLTCSFLECVGEACVPRGPSHLLFLFLPTRSWILFLPLPPLSLFLKASFVAAHLLHDSAVCLTFGWKIELHHQPTTSFKLKRPFLPYSLI